MMTEIETIEGGKKAVSSLEGSALKNTSFIVSKENMFLLKHSFWRPKKEDKSELSTLQSQKKLFK